VNGEGYREILGICEGAKEDKAGWSAFLSHLKERGRVARWCRAKHYRSPPSKSWVAVFRAA
jgi:hypothetical protein